MGAYKPPVPVKLVVGLLGTDAEILKQAQVRLQERFGAIEETMPPIPFTWTNYYADELGPEPWRSFISFEALIPREELTGIKRWTNDLEADFSVAGVRKVNLDPGYMTLGQFFLATTKDQRHRVYVGNGIFVEGTLFFEAGGWRPFPWTYPDYRSEEYKPWFLAARAKLAYQLRHEGRPHSRRKSQEGNSD